MRIKAFFDAVGAFFSWCWKYPLTPIENFQDARTRYKLSIDQEIKEIYEYFEEIIEKDNSLKESEKREVIIKCTDNCSCVSVDKWSDEEIYYLTFYKSYTERGLWFRLKTAFKVLMGKDIIGAELILEEKDFNKIRKFK